MFNARAKMGNNDFPKSTAEWLAARVSFSDCSALF